MSTEIKKYPRRGPLQLLRLATAEPFRCFRCGAHKTAKLRALYGDDDSAMLCNSCYGELLSIFEIKSGTEPDDTRAEKLATVLQDMAKRWALNGMSGGFALARLNADAIGPARRQRTLAPSAVMSGEADLFLRTAKVVATRLATVADLDWSVAVLGLCKAFEVEVVGRILMPLRDRLGTADLSADIADPHTKELALYVARKTSRPPTLGSVAFTFELAGREADGERHSRLLAEIRRLSTLSNGWLIAVDGFSAGVRELTRRFRNPAVHLDVMGRQDYEACDELLFGGGELVMQLVVGTEHV